MNEPQAELVTCRLCKAPVARHAAVCPSCGVKAPWIPDEPSISPRVIRIAMWGAGVVVVLLLLFVSGILYHCEMPCPDLVRQLHDVYATFPGSKYGHVKLLVTPANSLKPRLAILAWRWIDEPTGFDRARLLRFYRAHVDQGPEDIP